VRLRTPTSHYTVIPHATQRSGVKMRNHPQASPERARDGSRLVSRCAHSVQAAVIRGGCTLPKNAAHPPFITVDTVGFGHRIEAGLTQQHALQVQQGGARALVQRKDVRRRRASRGAASRRVEPGWRSPSVVLLNQHQNGQGCMSHNALTCADTLRD
jgi:hypothetical protein